jgi:hypothetical protein
LASLPGRTSTKVLVKQRRFCKPWFGDGQGQDRCVEPAVVQFLNKLRCHGLAHMDIQTRVARCQAADDLWQQVRRDRRNDANPQPAFQRFLGGPGKISELVR